MLPSFHGGVCLWCSPGRVSVIAALWSAWYRPGGVWDGSALWCEYIKEGLGTDWEPAGGLRHAQWYTAQERWRRSVVDTHRAGWHKGALLWIHGTLWIYGNIDTNRHILVQMMTNKKKRKVHSHNMIIKSHTASILHINAHASGDSSSRELHAYLGISIFACVLFSSVVRPLKIRSGDYA